MHTHRSGLRQRTLLSAMCRASRLSTGHQHLSVIKAFCLFKVSSYLSGHRILQIFSIQQEFTQTVTITQAPTAVLVEMLGFSDLKKETMINISKSFTHHVTQTMHNRQNLLERTEMTSFNLKPYFMHFWRFNIYFSLAFMDHSRTNNMAVPIVIHIWRTSAT